MSRKQLVFRNPNRVLIHTGHKTFDSQCDLLSTGNVMSNVQFSSFIRPVSETECNGFTFDRGHLFNVDIKAFRPDLPSWIENWLRSLDTKVILYQIRHWSGRDRKHVHGYIVTDTEHKPLRVFTTGPQRFKSEHIMSTVLPYIAEVA